MSLKNPNVLNPRRPKRVAVVIANPAISTTSGWPAGFWWSELTHPYHVFTEAGNEVEIFSPDGGGCEADAMSDPRDVSGYSASDLISMGFIATPKLAALVANTREVSEIAVKDFDALIVAGGQAPMFTFDKATRLIAKFVGFTRREKSPARCAMAWRCCVTRDCPTENFLPREKRPRASPTWRRISPTTPCGA